MKKHFIIFTILLFFPVLAFAQETDQLISKCATNTGVNSTYLKDFRVQLGKGISQAEFRYRQVFPLSRNMKYRFTLCNPDNSKSELIMKIKDETGRLILASFDEKSGKTYPSIDFTCNKTGTYQIYFDFLNFQQGLGVGIISLVK